MKVVKIRERNNEFQVYEKDFKKIVFRGKTRQSCFHFLAENNHYAYEATQEKGVHYVF